MSKEQIAFNKLSGQIDALEKSLIDTKGKLDAILTYHNKNVLPVQKSLAASEVQLAKAISDASYNDKFSRKQKEQFGEVIVDLLDKAFGVIQPDEATEKLYDQWAESSYKEECESMDSQAKDMMNDMLKNEWGIDTDLSQFENTPEGQAQLMAHLKALMEEAQQKKKMEYENNIGSGKGKSKKQTAKEKQQREQEALQLKSLRSIYISLAKALHPDTETDEDAKAIKEELMKKVTVAYDNRDLAALLKLEIEWINQGDAQLEKLSDEKLKLYVNILKEKLANLKTEKEMMSHNPHYMGVAHLMHESEKTAIKQMKNHTQKLSMVSNDFISMAKDFRDSQYRKDLLEFVSEYQESMSFRQMMKQFSFPS